MQRIYLTQNKIALVDDEDFQKLNQYSWYYHLSDGDKIGYARTKMHKKVILMHRLIMNPPEGYEVQHIDRNGINNQKSNLRIINRTQKNQIRAKSQNSSSQYKGVSYNKRDKKWQAYITINRKLVHLGAYKIEKEAAKIYDEYARTHFGEFAQLNFQ